jgi:hypothetical protein
MKIFLICLLEELDTAIAFICGGMFMWAVVLRPDLWWVWLVVAFFAALLTNLSTELIWRMK